MSNTGLYWLTYFLYENLKLIVALVLKYCSNLKLKWCCVETKKIMLDTLLKVKDSNIPTKHWLHEKKNALVKHKDPHPL